MWQQINRETGEVGIPHTWSELLEFHEFSIDMLLPLKKFEG